MLETSETSSKILAAQCWQHKNLHFHLQVEENSSGFLACFYAYPTNVPEPAEPQVSLVTNGKTASEAIKCLMEIDNWEIKVNQDVLQRILASFTPLKMVS
jgi:hypothetical protein